MNVCRIRIANWTTVLVLCWVVVTMQQSGIGCQSDLYQQAIAAATSKVAPSMVQIETVGGLDSIDGQPVGQGPRTGFCLRPGYIVTSSYNLAHQPAAVFLKLPEGRRVSAEVVGFDHLFQLSVLKFDSSVAVPPVSLADPAELRVGHRVVALGKVYDSEEPNVSVGIVSAMGRIWGRAVQTDARISSSNYGGPLVNLKGEVIGVLAPQSPDDRKLSGGRVWYDSGIGFAVRLDRMLSQWERLLKEGELHPGRHGITVRGQNIYADPVEVLMAASGSPAQTAGVLPEDLIVECNGESVQRIAQWRHQTGSLYAGEKLKLLVEREVEEVAITVELVAKLLPYEPPGLGVMVAEQGPRLVVTSVIDRDSPLKPGDLLRRIEGKGIRNRRILENVVARSTPGQTQKILVQRGDESVELEVVVGKASAVPWPGLKKFESTEVRKWKISVPEFTNLALGWSPEGACEGVLVWLSEGRIDEKEIRKRWLESVKENRVAILVLESERPGKWRSDESEFVMRAIQIFLGKLAERPGIAIGGTRAGGTMAAAICMKNRSRFRGLVMHHAEMGLSMETPRTSAGEPLLVYLSTRKTSAGQAESSTEALLRKQKFPVYSDARPENESIPISRFLDWVRAIRRT